MGDELEIPQESGSETGEPSPQGSPVSEAARAVLAQREAEEREDADRRGPGRPKGVRDRRPRKRRTDSRRRERPAPAAPELQPPEPEAELEPPSEAELKALGKAAENLWRLLACRFGARRPLSPAEGVELAEAAHPVLAKYLGRAVDKFGPEFALALTVWGLWELTAPPAPAALGDADAGA